MHLVPPFTGMVWPRWCGVELGGARTDGTGGGLDSAKTCTEVVEEAAASGRDSGLHF